MSVDTVVGIYAIDFLVKCNNCGSHPRTSPQTSESKIIQVQWTYLSLIYYKENLYPHVTLTPIKRKGRWSLIGSGLQSDL